MSFMLPPALARSFLGFDRTFNRMVDMLDHEEVNYPPYNLIKKDETHLAIEVALSGFKQDEITVSLDANVLRISGDKTETKKPEGYTYVFQGIGARRFIREFTIAETMEVESASFEDGILTVNIFDNIPETKKLRTIKVESPKLLTK